MFWQKGAEINETAAGGQNIIDKQSPMMNPLGTKGLHMFIFVYALILWMEEHCTVTFVQPLCHFTAVIWGIFQMTEVSKATITDEPFL